MATASGGGKNKPATPRPRDEAWKDAAREVEIQRCLVDLGVYLRRCAENKQQESEYYLTDARKCLESLARIWALKMNRAAPGRTPADEEAKESLVSQFIGAFDKAPARCYAPIEAGALRTLQQLGNLGSHAQFRDLDLRRSTEACRGALLTVLPWFFEGAGVWPPLDMPPAVVAALASFRAPPAAPGSSPDLAPPPGSARLSPAPLLARFPAFFGRSRPAALAGLALLVGLLIAAGLLRATLKAALSCAYSAWVAPEKVVGWGWSNRCQEQRRAGRLWLARKMCERGLTAPDKNPEYEAAVDYQLGLIADLEGDDLRALDRMTRAMTLFPRPVYDREQMRLCLKAGAPSPAPGENRRMMTLLHAGADGGNIRLDASSTTALLGTLVAPACVLAGATKPDLLAPAERWFQVKALVKGRLVEGWMHEDLLGPKDARPAPSAGLPGAAGRAPLSSSPDAEVSAPPAQDRPAPSARPGGDGVSSDPSRH